MAFREQTILKNRYFCHTYQSDARIDCWIYGHSHTNIDTQIGGTKIVCNHLGYVFQQEHLDNWFSHVKMIDV